MSRVSTCTTEVKPDTGSATDTSTAKAVTIDFTSAVKDLSKSRKQKRNWYRKLDSKKKSKSRKSSTEDEGGEY